MFLGRDDYFESVSIDLSELSKEVTHDIWKDIDNKSDGGLHLTITINETDETNDESLNIDTNLEIQSRYVNIKFSYYFKYILVKFLLKFQGLNKSFNSLKDVGVIQLTVYSARGLKSADFSGMSDPYFTVELGNSYTRSQTLFNTLDPDWNKKVFL